MIETWKPAPSYEGRYEISDLGRVRAIHRARPHVMSPVPDSNGYATVKLYQAGVGTRRKVSRLVCHAFHGAPFGSMDAAHLDGSPNNNRADNLAWATRKENMSHKILHGTHQRGERGTGAKLTQDQADQIIQRAAAGETCPDLAREFGITRGHIRRIANGKVGWHQAPLPSPLAQEGE